MQHILALLSYFLPLLPYFGPCCLCRLYCLTHCYHLMLVLLWFFITFILRILLGGSYIFWESSDSTPLFDRGIWFYYHFACWNLEFSLPTLIMEHFFYYRLICWNFIFLLHAYIAKLGNFIGLFCGLLLLVTTYAIALCFRPLEKEQSNLLLRSWFSRRRRRNRAICCQDSVSLSVAELFDPQLIACLHY